MLSPEAYDFGDVPDSVTRVLYGARLIPLRKRDGGIRPIAIGNSLRSLASRLISKRSVHLNGLFAPLQLGFSYEKRLRDRRARRTVIREAKGGL